MKKITLLRFWMISSLTSLFFWASATPPAPTPSMPSLNKVDLLVKAAELERQALVNQATNIMKAQELRDQAKKLREEAEKMKEETPALAPQEPPVIPQENIPIPVPTPVPAPVK